MKRQLLKKLSVLFVVILFSLMSGVALAQKKHWFVVKDKNGVCRVIEAETIAGPFKTMEEAEKRKAKDCPKGAGQATEQAAAPPARAARTDAASTPAARRASATTAKATASAAATTTEAGASAATGD